MTDKPEIIPLLLLKGRSPIFKEFSRKYLKDLSKTLRENDFEELYLLDVDGIERNKPQLDVVQFLSDDFSIYYEGGPRHGANVIDMLMAGAEIAYMSTYSISSLDDIKIALTYTENVAFKIDWNDGLLGPSEDISSASLGSLLDSVFNLGIKEFAFPAEILDECASRFEGREAKLRVIADRPGDENITDARIDSLIVDLNKLLQKGEPLED